MNEFQRKAEEIGRSFQTQYSKEWVRGTGRADLANALLNQMRAARSPEQFERAAYQFKQQIVIPYYREVVYPQGTEQERADFLARNPIMQMQPRKPLGTYAELQKNPAFAQSRYKYLAPGARDSVPSLMRIAEDPAELDLASRELGVAPEDLGSHIREQYNQQAREQFRKDMMAAAVEGQRYRDSLAKDYEESTLGQVLGTIAPEVTGLRLKQIREGSGNFDFTRDFLFGRMFPRNGKVDREKASESWDLAKAIAKDAIVGIGSIYGPARAVKIVSGPIKAAALGGAIDAGLEAARQGMSDYYDWDLGNIKDVGVVSATLPATVGILSGAVSGIPGLGRLTRPLMRKLRGMLPDAAAEEKSAANRMREGSKQAIEAATESGSPILKEGAEDLMEKEVRPFLNESPWEANVEKNLTKNEAVDLVMDEDASKLYFNPPTPDEFAEMAARKAAGEEYAADWIERAKKQWPQNYKKVSVPPAKPTKLDRLVDMGVDVASREETLRKRASGKRLENSAPSTALTTIMEQDPTLIQMWRAGFAPSDEVGKKLYDEWKAKFGE